MCIFPMYFHVSVGDPCVGIYRPIGGDLFRLVHKTRLPHTAIGNHSYNMDCPWQVLQGDVIGLHTYNGNDVVGISQCIEDKHGNDGNCMFGTYTSIHKSNEKTVDSDITKNMSYRFSNNVPPRIMAIRALYV